MLPLPRRPMSFWDVCLFFFDGTITEKVWVFI